MVSVLLEAHHEDHRRFTYSQKWENHLSKGNFILQVLYHEKLFFLGMQAVFQQIDLPVTYRHHYEQNYLVFLFSLASDSRFLRYLAGTYPIS